MSLAHTTDVPFDAPEEGAAPAAPATGAARRRRSLIRWVGGAGLTAAAITALAIAVWPASATDKARADGEQLGQAVHQLFVAQTPEDVDAALAEVHAAAADTREHAGDRVADQATDQEDALARAVDGFVGVHTSSDAFSVDVYQAELNVALDDLADNAEDFRTEGPEVQQAFWDGYQTGLEG